MFKLGFIFGFYLFIYFLCNEHTFTYSCINVIGAEMQQGK